MRSIKLFSPAEKTPFSRSALLVLFQSFIPGITSWIVFGKDVNVLNIHLSVMWQIIIIAILLVWTIMSTYLCYKFKLSNFDQFGFSIPLMIVLIIMFITSIYNISFWIRLIIALLSIIASTLIINLIVYYCRIYLH